MLKGDVWFAKPPHEIIHDLGFSAEIARKKIENLIDFADGRIELYFYLCLLPEAMRESHGEEWINIIIGPLAAELKLPSRDGSVDGWGFERRRSVLPYEAVIELFEAYRLGLIPDSSSIKKTLYEKLMKSVVPSFLVEMERHRLLGADFDNEATIREIFYGVLAEVIEPVFSEASGGELDAMIARVLEVNPAQAELVRSGDQKVIGWAMGQILRSSTTKLDPNTVRAAILKATA